MKLQEWARQCPPNMVPVLDMLLSKLVQQFQTIEGVTYHYIEALVQTSTFFDSLNIQSADVMDRKQALLKKSLDFLNRQLGFGVVQESRNVYTLAMDEKTVRKLNSYRTNENERGRLNVAPHAGRPFPAIMYHAGQERIPERAFIANRVLCLSLLRENTQTITRLAPTLASLCRLKTYPEFQEKYKQKRRPSEYLNKEVKQPIETYGLFKVQFSDGVAVSAKKAVVTCNYDLRKGAGSDEDMVRVGQGNSATKVAPLSKNT